MSSVRPSVRSAGLPSNPRARSSSRSRAADDASSSYSIPREPMPRMPSGAGRSSDGRSVRPQHSMSSISSAVRGGATRRDYVNEPLPTRSSRASEDSYAQRREPPRSRESERERYRETPQRTDSAYERRREPSHTREPAREPERGRYREPPRPSAAGDERRREQSRPRESERRRNREPPRADAEPRERRYESERSRQASVREVPRERARSPPRIEPSARYTRSNTSSPTSDVPSVFDRNAARSEASSTRTSWDDAGSKSGSGGKRPGWVGNSNDYNIDDDRAENPDPAMPLQTPNSSTTPGFGASLWSRVADAASVLSVSVSQAWTDRFPVSSGEVTPPGQESTLSRALKSYHLEKADDPTALPDWLFTTKERGLGSSVVDSEERDDRRVDRNDSPSYSAPSRGSRNDSQISSTAGGYSRSSGDVDKPTTKAGDRLKALRDMKRNQTMRMNALARNDVERERTDTRMAERAPAPQPPARMGLPGRPGVGHRV